MKTTIGIILLFCVVVGILCLGVTPSWSDTGVVVSSTSQFSDTSWKPVVIIQSVNHGLITFSPNFWTGCGSSGGNRATDIAYLSPGQTVGLWSNYYGCIFVVAK